MIKYYCDSCKDEHSRINTFKVPCHLYSLKGQSGYVDSQWNAISGRFDEIHLCNKCLNIAYEAAINALNLDSK